MCQFQSTSFSLPLFCSTDFKDDAITEHRILGTLFLVTSYLTLLFSVSILWSEKWGKKLIFTP